MNSASRFAALTDAGQTLSVYASAARTATPTAVDQANVGYRGVHLTIDCTAVTSTPSVVFTIKGLDPVSGKYYTILASAAIVATGTTRLSVYPGCIAAANSVANDALPAVWKVDAVHGNANSITYTVGANYLN